MKLPASCVMLSAKTFPQTNMNYNDFWDNVLKQEEWNDELKRWENAHPEYESFEEDSRPEYYTFPQQIKEN